MFRLFLVIVWLGLCLSGCHVFTHDRTGLWPEQSRYSRHFDEAHARCIAEKRALNALGACHPHAASEFKYGFVQAYVDIALGSDGRPPAIPPERFWKTCNRHPDGHCEAGEWYEGYAAGAQRALGSCWKQYNVVPAGGFCPSGWGSCGQECTAW
jgi:hypothetical protein